MKAALNDDVHSDDPKPIEEPQIGGGSHHKSFFSHYHLEKFGNLKVWGEIRESNKNTSSSSVTCDTVINNDNVDGGGEAAKCRVAVGRFA